MNALRSAILWTVGLSYMTLVLLLVFVAVWFVAPERIDAWIRRRATRLFRLIHCPVEVSGIVPDPRDGPFIFMANHTSLLDVPLMKAVIPVYFRGILSDHQFSWPLYGPVLKRTLQLPIPRQSIRGSRRVYAQALEVLKDGVSIAVLPEGNRSLSGKLGRFRNMPFQFALDAGVPIIPIGLDGPFEIKNKGSWHLCPRVIHVRFGRAIAGVTPSEAESRDVVALKNEVRAAIKALILGEIPAAITPELSAGPTCDGRTQSTDPA